ncbi:Spermidine N(1)-acetyltransferase [Escherichia coli]|nr:Spermidine N(1)-acetyltransferase [Escherichia coli]
MPSAHSVKLRPLEREDLRYVHQLDNKRQCDALLV